MNLSNDRILLSLSAPTGEPQDVSAVTESNSTIRVAWAPPPEAERNGLITNYVVKYYASASPNAARFSNTTDGSTTLLIGGLQSFQVYDFTVRAVNKAGIGPESETVSNKTFEAGELTYGVLTLCDQFKFPLQPQQKYFITQYAELGFS